MEQAKSYKDDYPELPPKVDSTGQIISPVLLAPPEYYLKEPEPLDLTETKEITPVEATVPCSARKKNEITLGKVKGPRPAQKKKANNRRSEKEALKSTAETSDTGEADVTVQSISTTPPGDLTNSQLANDSNDQWELVQGTTDVLHSGNPAPEALTIRLRQKVTGEMETHVFQTLSPQVLDWNNRFHVADISRWRYNILHGRGMACERVVMPYFPAEEAWLLLLHKKIKAVVEAGHKVKMPTLWMMVDGFNAFFQGQVLQDVDGHDLFPRDARDGVSIKGKLRSFNSGVPRVREVTRKLLEGKKGGEVYMPVIRQDELGKYQEDGTIEIADFEDRKANGAALSPKRRREATEGEGSDAKRVKP
ncbi:hypothetical protein BDU57DRAFT_524605 [Ampelomyces quisqualis]|uniref:Uncharacterized protein n=1 Tax=Ampelomyces quisqualis TaxID=50730 RepID=A0A6A5Q7P9_AMPQU|nr:hypothetical protein BDU57DRAFT_524605 [Ampelomyces quisqualis]